MQEGVEREWAVGQQHGACANAAEHKIIVLPLSAYYAQSSSLLSHINYAIIPNRASSSSSSFPIIFIMLIISIIIIKNISLSSGGGSSVSKLEEVSNLLQRWVLQHFLFVVVVVVVAGMAKENLRKLVQHLQHACSLHSKSYAPKQQAATAATSLVYPVKHYSIY